MFAFFFPILFTFVGLIVWLLVYHPRPQLLNGFTA
jgi:hypothetical protein